MNRLMSCTSRFLLLLMALSLLPLSAATAEQQPAPKETLVAVIPADFPPTYFRDQNGQPAGLAVDVMNAVAKHAGLTITYRFAKPWQEIEDLVKNGEADLVPLRVMNETNQQKLRFTTPLDVSYIHFVVRADDTSGKLRPHARIGVINNSAAAEYLKKQAVPSQLVLYDSLEHMLIDLLSGRVDLLLTVTDNLKALAERLRLKDRFKIVHPAELEVKRGIAVQPDNQLLQERLNKAIEAFHRDTESARIYRKWLAKPPPYWSTRRVSIALGALFVVALGGLLALHITSLRKTNRQLKAEQAFLQTMIDAIPDFIFFKDRHSRYRGCNKAFAERVLGRSKDSLTGLSDADLHPQQELAATFIRTDQEVLQSGQPIQFEVSVPLKDGSLIRAEAIKVPFRDDTGQVIGVIGISRDITERHLQLQQLEEARERAEVASHAKSQFLANMSHEIRTPLNGVLGMAQLLAMTDLDQNQQEYLDMVRISGENLLGILNDILDLAKIEAGMLTIIDTSFSPAELVSETINFFRYPCSQKGVELLATLDQDLPARVVGDQQRVRQILFNLLGNAVKFTHTGRISLTCSIVPTTSDRISLLFKVRDTGIGISPQDQERIFSPFEQVDNSNTREYGGTGLGLAICQRLTKALGGSLTLDSTVGQGSCFSLELGFKQESGVVTQACEEQKLSAADPERAKMTLLVAEDNEINRFFMVKLLQRLGHRVLEAEDGQQALEQLQQYDCDLVLMDIQMPVLDGTKALQEIRQRDTARQRHTEVIALTAYAMHGDCEKFLALGFDGYLPKPLQAGDLETLVKSYQNRNASP